MTKEEFIIRLKEYAKINKETYSFIFNYTHALSLDIYDLFKMLWELYFFIAKNINDKELCLGEKDLQEIILEKKIKDWIKTIFLKLTEWLIGDKNYREILLILEKMMDALKNIIKEELIEISWQEVKQYCFEMEKERIIEKSDKILDYEDLWCFSQEILDKQIEDNNIPDIAKEDFFELYPEFAEKIDKDELLDLSIDNYDLVKNANTDGMYYKDYFIYYDDFFIENKYTVPWFLNFFYDYLKETKDLWNNFRIRLNYDKIISVTKYKQVVLAWAWWFGPEFREEDIFTRIRNKTISTKKIRNNPKFSERFGNNIKETEFYLNQENSDFQIEEITQDEKDSYYINRFVHSEFDIKNKKIKHFDGELLYYKKNVYSQRLWYTLEKNKKVNENKKKIFRIDGQIDVQKWKELILHFFVNNEMILEYFDIDAYKEEYKDILDYENWVDY